MPGVFHAFTRRPGQLLTRQACVLQVVLILDQREQFGHGSGGARNLDHSVSLLRTMGLRVDVRPLDGALWDSAVLPAIRKLAAWCQASTKPDGM